MDKIEAAVLLVQEQVSNASPPIRDALMELFHRLRSMEVPDSYNTLSFDAWNREQELLSVFPGEWKVFEGAEVAKVVGVIIDDRRNKIGDEYLILSDEGLFLCSSIIWRNINLGYRDQDSMIPNWSDRRPASPIDWVRHFERIIARCREKAETIIHIKRFQQLRSDSSSSKAVQQ